jgi:hypothetical protein
MWLFAPHEAKAVGCAVILAVVTDFISAEVFPALALGELIDGHSRANRRIRIGIGSGLAALLVVDGGGFEGPDTEETTAGDGHGFDEHVLAGSGGFKFVDERGDELKEAGPGFAFDQDGVGEQTVSGGVAPQINTDAHRWAKTLREKGRDSLHAVGKPRL